MDRLTSMAVFAKVADLGSFTAAAKELRISPTMIGKHIRFLEERLGSQLINRSTRRQSLTELGRSYLDHCKRLLEEAEAGDALVEEAMSAPRGKLRVATSVAFGSYSLAPALVRFMKIYPEVTVDLVLSDKMVDLLEEGLDAAIRVGTLTDSTMMSRALSPYTGVVCAAPSYLAERGTPAHPHDLAGHECLRYPGWSDGQRWTFLGPDGEIHVDVKSRLTMNSTFAIRYAALAGAGIVLMRDELLAGDIAAGRLKVLLPDYRTQSRARQILWPKHRKMTPKLRALIDFVVETYG
ncbi:HTH-type transcriptional regulator DmlR [Bradyrhizobium ivorense]|uniref:HTH-type transcriptional regulator DmlR n=1 Tax=Bradyrhizobium ivorense TaxID=2511166 RepID=A0A508SY11_9BRAD|nr:LysR family transcriptional regulator [Bradyrhizobium ivorense]VIO65828.1 HTH-type transcriptional regulator DmlR [Bradyrhizobium ivorense]